MTRDLKRTLEREAKAAAELRLRLREEVGVDGELWRDTLEGQTNLLELIDRCLDAMDQDRVTAGLLAEYIVSARVRKARLEKRVETTRCAIARALEQASLSQCPIQRLRHTLSVGRSPGRVEIMDTSMLPPWAWRTPVTPAPEPDVERIRVALREGHEVPGARLVGEGTPTLIVRST